MNPFQMFLHTFENSPILLYLAIFLSGFATASILDLLVKRIEYVQAYKAYQIEYRTWCDTKPTKEWGHYEQFQDPQREYDLDHERWWSREPHRPRTDPLTESWLTVKFKVQLYSHRVRHWFSNTRLAHYIQHVQDRRFLRSLGLPLSSNGHAHDWFPSIGYDHDDSNNVDNEWVCLDCGLIQEAIP